MRYATSTDVKRLCVSSFFLLSWLTAPTVTYIKEREEKIIYDTGTTFSQCVCILWFKTLGFKLLAAPALNIYAWQKLVFLPFFCGGIFFFPVEDILSACLALVIRS